MLGHVGKEGNIKLYQVDGVNILRSFVSIAGPIGHKLLVTCSHTTDSTTTYRRAWNGTSTRRLYGRAERGVFEQ